MLVDSHVRCHVRLMLVVTLTWYSHYVMSYLFVGAAIGPLLAGVLNPYGWHVVFYMLIGSDAFAMVVSFYWSNAVSHIKDIFFIVYIHDRNLCRWYNLSRVCSSSSFVWCTRKYLVGVAGAGCPSYDRNHWTIALIFDLWYQYDNFHYCHLSLPFTVSIFHDY